MYPIIASHDSQVIQVERKKRVKLLFYRDWEIVFERISAQVKYKKKVPFFEIIIIRKALKK